MEQWTGLWFCAKALSDQCGKTGHNKGQVVPRHFAVEISANIDHVVRTAGIAVGSTFSI